MGDPSVLEWRLPAALREISALALTASGELLAVDDERAVVHELDHRNGRRLGAFALGEPALKGDFEGLAVVGDQVYLMDSDGDLYAAPIGEDGDRVSFERISTGLDEHCEFEGLATDAGRGRLLLLCKDLKKRAEFSALSVLSFDLNEKRVHPDERVELPEQEIAEAIGKRRLHPSGIAVHPGTGNWLIVAARQRALIEMTPAGRLVSARRLPGDGRHRQAEGIEVTADGRLVLADEGGKGKAKLSIYEAGPRSEADE